MAILRAQNRAQCFRGARAVAVTKHLDICCAAVYDLPMISDLSKLAMNANEAASVDEALTKVRDLAILEPKLDGIRVLVHVGELGVRMYARSGNRKYGLTKIEAELAQAFPVGTWLDAEAVAFNSDGSQNWGGAMKCLGSSPKVAESKQEPIRLIVFDILSYGDTDARGNPLEVRRNVLEQIFERRSDVLERTQLVAQFEATQENHNKIVAAGYEGTMVKDIHAPYVSGKRGWSWTKVKLVETIDVVVTGYTDGKGKRANYFGAIIFGQYLPDGTFVEDRGQCSGMTDAQLKEINDNREKYLNTVIEISYRTKMTDKKTGLPNYRHPQFERFRWDKTATECVLEEAA